MVIRLLYALPERVFARTKMLPFTAPVFTLRIVALLASVVYENLCSRKISVIGGASSHERPPPPADFGLQGPHCPPRARPLVGKHSRTCRCSVPLLHVGKCSGEHIGMVGMVSGNIIPAPLGKAGYTYFYPAFALIIFLIEVWLT